MIERWYHIKGVVIGYVVIFKIMAKEIGIFGAVSYMWRNWRTHITITFED
jgi:hypothetical protein